MTVGVLTMALALLGGAYVLVASGEALVAGIIGPCSKVGGPIWRKGEPGTGASNPADAARLRRSLPPNTSPANARPYDPTTPFARPISFGHTALIGQLAQSGSRGRHQVLPMSHAG